MPVFLLVTASWAGKKWSNHVSQAMVTFSASRAAARPDREARALPAPPRYNPAAPIAPPLSRFLRVKPLSCSLIPAPPCPPSLSLPPRSAQRHPVSTRGLPPCPSPGLRDRSLPCCRPRSGRDHGLRRIRLQP